MAAAQALAVASIVLVHGAWADGSGWHDVYSILKKDGYQVSIVQNPETSLADDVAAATRVIDQQKGPVILVGHSYGGEVITEAGNDPKVAGLVYIAAFGPDQGESLQSLGAKPVPGYAPPPVLPPQNGFLYLDTAKFHAAFAADLDDAKADFLANSQVPLSVAAFAAPIDKPSWRSKPSWYMLTQEDKMIPPPAQQFMSKRMKATVVEIKASHAVYISHPADVAALIEQAAKKLGLAPH